MVLGTRHAVLAIPLKQPIQALSESIVVAQFFNERVGIVASMLMVARGQQITEGA